MEVLGSETDRPLSRAAARLRRPDAHGGWDAHAVHPVLCSGVRQLAGARILVGRDWKLNFASEDYLGLRRHPKVKQGAIAAIRRFGAGEGAPGMSGDETPLSRALEEALADLLGREGTMLFATVDQAHAALLTCLVEPGQVVLADNLAPASLTGAGRMAGAVVRRARRGSKGGMVYHLRAGFSPQLLVFETLCGVDGGVAPISQVMAALQSHPQTLVVGDESHALGVLGPRGAGLLRGEPGVTRADFVTASLGLALGSLGGFVSGDAEAIAALRDRAATAGHRARPAPASLGAALAALRLAVEDPEGRREKVAGLATQLREGLDAAGFDTWRASCHVVPVVFDDAGQAGRLAQRAFEAGLHCSVLTPAQGARRSALRFSVTADLTRTDIDRAVDIVTTAAREIGG